MLGKVLHNAYQGGLPNQLYLKTVGCRYLSPTVSYVQNQICEWRKSHLCSYSVRNVSTCREDSNIQKSEPPEKQERSDYDGTLTELKTLHDISPEDYTTKIRKLKENQNGFSLQNALSVQTEQLLHIQQFSSQNDSQENVVSKEKNVCPSSECNTFHMYERGNETKNKIIIGCIINMNSWDKPYFSKQISPFSIYIQSRNISHTKGENTGKSPRNENQKKQSNKVKALNTEDSHFQHAFFSPNIPINKPGKLKSKLSQTTPAFKSIDLLRSSKSEVKGETNMKASLISMSSRSDTKIPFSTSCDNLASKQMYSRDCEHIHDDCEEKKTDDCLDFKKKEEHTKLPEACIKKDPCAPKGAEKDKSKSCRECCDKLVCEGKVKKKKKPKPCKKSKKAKKPKKSKKCKKPKTARKGLLQRLCSKIQRITHKKKKCPKKKTPKKVCKKKPKKVDPCAKKQVKQYVGKEESRDCPEEKKPVSKKCEKPPKKDKCKRKKGKKVKYAKKKGSKKCKKPAKKCDVKRHPSALCIWLQKKLEGRQRTLYCGKKCPKPKRKASQINVGDCSAFRRFLSRRKK